MLIIKITFFLDDLSVSVPVDQAWTLNTSKCSGNRYAENVSLWMVFVSYCGGRAIIRS